LPFDYQTVVGGDGACLSIACASIVAKVTRDRILKVYHSIFPQYNFQAHKGYPTREHCRALARWGPSGIHRRTYQWS